MKTKWAFPLFLGVLLAFFASRPGRGGSLVTRMEGTAPAWTMKDVAGRTISSTNFAGRVVVLNFWATWCPPCREEIPDFIDFVRKHDTNKVVIIGASVDEGGADLVKSFAEAYKINYPVVMADRSTQEAFGGVPGYPTTFVIGTNGAFVTRHLGPMSKSDFARFVEPMIAK